LNKKVNSVTFAHIGLVLLWLGVLEFTVAYASNYSSFLLNPEVKPSSQYVSAIVGQSLLNGDTGSEFSGISIVTGIFSVYLTQGLINISCLKSASITLLGLSFLFLLLGYSEMHLTTSFVLRAEHLVCLIGLASISWCGHIIHIASPGISLLAEGLSPTDILPSQLLIDSDLSSRLLTRCLAPGYFSSIACHHYYSGLVLVLASVFRYFLSRDYLAVQYAKLNPSYWNLRLAVALMFTSLASFVLAHNLSSGPTYIFISADYPSILSGVVHHIIISSFLLIGSFSHFSISIVSELKDKPSLGILTNLLSHRDLVLGHLIWVSIFLGTHSFGIFVHNDTLQSLSRSGDTFSDLAIQLKPYFASSLNSSNPSTLVVYLPKIVRSTTLLGTTDFLVHHIHAFTLHTALLILLKGVLYSRSSRLIPDKALLGFRFPCDGPGRGGTCQVSSWDHSFLGAFWVYNSLAIVLFHFFWVSQSEVWGRVTGLGEATHLTSGDFSVNGSSINGWLRSFLWSESAQVIQSYSTSLASYGLIFLLSHFVWALSLMFLFSGRGYWQELIESILWAHAKLKFYPYIQPRALSITQGRAVGLTHFLLGAIGVTWSFFLARIISLN